MKFKITKEWLLNNIELEEDLEVSAGSPEAIIKWLEQEKKKEEERKKHLDELCG